MVMPMVDFMHMADPLLIMDPIPIPSMVEPIPYVSLTIVLNCMNIVVH